jgi:hypothetical protein
MFVFITLSIFAFVFIYNLYVAHVTNVCMCTMVSIIQRSMLLITDLSDENKTKEYPERKHYIKNLQCVSNELIATLKIICDENRWSLNKVVLNIVNMEGYFMKENVRLLKPLDDTLTNAETQYKETEKVC